MPNYKVLIGEKDGTELDFPEELAHTASNVSASTANGLASDHVQGQLDELATAATNVFGTGFNHYNDQTESSTTSEQWQTKMNFNTSSLPLGNYIYFLTFGEAHTDGKEMHARLLVDDVQEAEFLTQTDHKAETGEYLYQNLFHVLHNASGVVNFKLQYTNTDNNGEMLIGNVQLGLWRIV